MARQGLARASTASGRPRLALGPFGDLHARADLAGLFRHARRPMSRPWSRACCSAAFYAVRAGPVADVRRHAAHQHRAGRLHHPRRLRGHRGRVADRRRRGMAGRPRGAARLAASAAALGAQRHAGRRDPLPSLVVTFGLSIVIQNLLLELFSADPRAIETGAAQRHARPGARRIAVARRAAADRAGHAALAATGALQWLFAHTALGRSFRAVSDDREIAELMGLDAKKVYAFATAIAFSADRRRGRAAGHAHRRCRPRTALLLLLFAFEAVIIGGMGSFWGTLAGAHDPRHRAAGRLPPRSGLGHLVRAHRVPGGARVPAAGPSSQDTRMTPMTTPLPFLRRGRARHRREPRAPLSSASCWCSSPPACRCGASRAGCASSSRSPATSSSR